MVKSRYKTTGLLGICLISLLATAAFAQRRNTVVVLENGSVFEGRISKLEHRVQVQLNSGGQITISADKIDFVSPSIREAYEFQASRLPRHDVKSRIKLARWCLDQELINSAADQLLLAQRIQPKHPAVMGFEHELMAKTLATGEPKIQLVGTRSSPKPAAVKSTPVSEASLVTFTTTIQPLLWNRCGASACHGQRSPSEFRLTIPARGTVPSRGMTHKNLQVALNHLSPDDPARSRLVVAARVPHGGNGRQIPAMTLDQYEQLLNWAIETSKSMPQENVAQSKVKPDVWLASFASPAVEEPSADPFDPAMFNAQQGHAKPDRQSPSKSDRPWWEVDP